ncbi:MAG: thermonuclease family protein [Bacillota bacterium]
MLPGAFTTVDEYADSRRNEVKPRFVISVFVVAVALALALTGCKAGTGPPDDNAASQFRQHQELQDQLQQPKKPKPPDPEYTFPPQELSMITCTVTRVVDGDTFHVDIAGADETVRLIGVDTPETHHPVRGIEPFGLQAEKYTRSQLEGRHVLLETDVKNRDEYGRLLAYVWLEDPIKINDASIRAKMFNARLLLDGCAQLLTVPPNVKYVDYFRKYQAEARENERELWGLGPAAAVPAAAKGPVIGNSRSKKFHRPDCQWAAKISPKNKITFRSREEAISAGYVACKVCRP